MNHQKVYNDIIENAKSKKRIKVRKNQEAYIYYENHHIIPRCLNGNDKNQNKVLLTPKEHFVCHKLLTYIYPNNYKIISAFHYMSFNKRYGNIVSAKDYAYARKLYISLRVENGIAKGKNNGMYKKGYLISGEKNGMHNKKHSIQTIKKIRKSKLGKPSGFSGKSFSLVSKEKLSKSNSKLTVEQKQEIYLFIINRLSNTSIESAITPLIRNYKVSRNTVYRAYNYISSLSS